MKCPICNGELGACFDYEENPPYNQDGDVITVESIYRCPACHKLLKYYEVFRMTDSGFKVLDLGS